MQIKKNNKSCENDLNDGWHKHNPQCCWELQLLGNNFTNDFTACQSKQVAICFLMSAARSSTKHHTLCSEGEEMTCCQKYRQRLFKCSLWGRWINHPPEKDIHGGAAGRSDRIQGSPSLRQFCSGQIDVWTTAGPVHQTAGVWLLLPAD